MKKSILCGIAVAAMAGLASIGRAQDNTNDQSLYPIILQQPVDQCVPIGSPATFSVVATNVDGYQWYKNNVVMDGQTNNSVAIAGAGIKDVGYYGVSVIKGGEAVPTRLASLNVYTTSSTTTTTTLTSTTTKTKMFAQTFSLQDLGGGGVVTVFGQPVVSGGGSGNCPGRYAGYVNFTKPAAQGWGWAPTAGETHTASDTNRTDTKVLFMGQWGDSGCAPTSVTASNPISPVYRFSIYFPTNTVVPTNVYSITLGGFDP